MIAMMTITAGMTVGELGNNQDGKSLPPRLNLPQNQGEKTVPVTQVPITRIFLTSFKIKLSVHEN